MFPDTPVVFVVVEGPSARVYLGVCGLFCSFLFLVRVVRVSSVFLSFQAGDPTDVMYGWCHKCREKFKDQYQALTG